MRGKFWTFVFLLFFLIGIGSAVTTINIKTLPHHTVFVTPLSTAGETLMMPMQGFSGEFGNVVFTFNEEEYDFDSSFFDLNVLIKEGVVVSHSERVKGGFIFGEETALITVLPEGIEPIYDNESEEEIVQEQINESSQEIVEENENVVSENATEKKGLFGSAYDVVERNKPVFYTIYYLLMMFILLSIIFFMFKRHIVSFTKNVGESVKKDKEEKEEDKKEKKKRPRERRRFFNFGKKDNNDIEDLADVDELAVAEKELKEAQEKVTKLREEKKESLAEAKKKLIEAEKEIMRLRGVKIDKEDKEITSEEMKKRLED